MVFDGAMTSETSDADFHATLHSLRVWDTRLPTLDPDTAPTDPLPLFREWLVDAAKAGQLEPHTMTLATVDAEGRPDVRTLMLHDADERGWHFASHATSVKGRQLAARPDAALGFYWPAVGGRSASAAGSRPVDPRKAARTSRSGPAARSPPR